MSNKKHPYTRNDTYTIVEEERVKDDAVEVDTSIEKVGVVVNCEKLNIREEASKDSKILHVVDAGTELTIDTERSLEGWYYISNADGVNGFCMKDYVHME